MARSNPITMPSIHKYLKNKNTAYPLPILEAPYPLEPKSSNPISRLLKLKSDRHFFNKKKTTLQRISVPSRRRENTEKNNRVPNE